MRVSDRDLIRGEHYGQRSCEPHPGEQYPYQVNALIHIAGMRAYSGQLCPHRCLCLLVSQNVADDFPRLAQCPDGGEASRDLAHVTEGTFAHRLAVRHQEIEDDRALCSCRRIRARRVCATYEQKR